MTIAVDTNVLLDILLPDPEFGPASKAALQQHYDAGALVIGEIVYSELAGCFSAKRALDEALDTLGIHFTASGSEACYRAGEAWKRYRASGGTRRRVVADFLIAAHAESHAEGLLTRDRGFHRKYFPHLRVVEPG